MHRILVLLLLLTLPVVAGQKFDKMLVTTNASSGLSSVSNGWFNIEAPGGIRFSDGSTLTSANGISTNTFAAAGGLLTLTVAGQSVSYGLSTSAVQGIITAYGYLTAVPGTYSTSNVLAAAWNADILSAWWANAATGTVYNAGRLGGSTAGSWSNFVNSKLSTSGGTITGDLTVQGNTYNTTVINISTNVYVGTTTNYVNETIYSTNISYTTYLVVTNQTITNTVDTYVNIGGSFTLGNGASLWATNASIYLPTLTITGTLARATGAWDWAGATWLNPPTNGWVFGTPGAVTNSASNVSGLTLTTSGGIVTLGGTLPSEMTTNQVQGIVNAMGLASTNVSQTAPSGTGSLIYSNNQFYFTPPSAAGLGSVTNVNITVNTSGGLTIDGSTSKVITNGGSYTLAQAASGGGATNELWRVAMWRIPANGGSTRIVNGDWLIITNTDYVEARNIPVYGVSTGKVMLVGLAGCQASLVWGYEDTTTNFPTTVTTNGLTANVWSNLTGMVHGLIAARLYGIGSCTNAGVKVGQ